jgi:hypothetical protein
LFQNVDLWWCNAEVDGMVNGGGNAKVNGGGNAEIDGEGNAASDSASVRLQLISQYTIMCGIIMLTVILLN